MASRAFTWFIVLCSGLILAGLFLDGWAHAHQRLEPALFGTTNLSRAFSPPGLPATLTARHLPYFAGVLLISIPLLVTLWANRARGVSWAHALPAGYGLSLVGGVLIAAALLGEWIWPLRFQTPLYVDPAAEGGVSSLPALLSPQRLAHLAGLVLLVTGPLRAGQKDPPGHQATTAGLPVVLALAFLLSILSYATQFAHPLVDPWASRAYLWRSLTSYRYGEFVLGESMGVLSIVLQSALLAAVILWAVRGWVLRPGSLTVILTINALLMAWLEGYWVFVLVGLTAGVVADVLLARLQHPMRRAEFSLFAFTVPAAYYALYFLVLIRLAGISPSWGTLTRLALPFPQGIGWNAQLVSGCVVLAGGVGWLLSYLMTASPSSTQSPRL